METVCVFIAKGKSRNILFIFKSLYLFLFNFFNVRSISSTMDVNVHNIKIEISSLRALFSKARVLTPLLILWRWISITENPVQNKAVCRLLTKPLKYWVPKSTDYIWYKLIEVRNRPVDVLINFTYTYRTDSIDGKIFKTPYCLFKSRYVSLTKLWEPNFKNVSHMFIFQFKCNF